ncbi:MAG: cupin domain-containing protein [Candidatus Rokubacteria bacterium]|nr:cupin domain-containing protein [Candidatus Rokubacteria bacterium]
MTKDAPRGRALRPADHVAYNDDAIVSKTLLDKKAGTLTLFAFDAGQKLSEHTSPYDAVVQVLDGEVVLVVGGEELRTAAGDLVIMPANVPHAVRAEQRCKLLLTMIR